MNSVATSGSIVCKKNCEFRKCRTSGVPGFSEVVRLLTKCSVTFMRPPTFEHLLEHYVKESLSQEQSHLQ